MRRYFRFNYSMERNGHAGGSASRSTRCGRFDRHNSTEMHFRRHPVNISGERRYQNIDTVCGCMRGSSLTAIVPSTIHQVVTPPKDSFVVLVSAVAQNRTDFAAIRGIHQRITLAKAGKQGAALLHHCSKCNRSSGQW